MPQLTDEQVQLIRQARAELKKVIAQALRNSDKPLLITVGETHAIELERTLVPSEAGELDVATFDMRPLITELLVVDVVNELVREQQQGPKGGKPQQHKKGPPNGVQVLFEGPTQDSDSPWFLANPPLTPVPFFKLTGLFERYTSAVGALIGRPFYDMNLGEVDVAYPTTAEENAAIKRGETFVIERDRVRLTNDATSRLGGLAKGNRVIVAIVGAGHLPQFAASNPQLGRFNCLQISALPPSGTYHEHEDSDQTVIVGQAGSETTFVPDIRLGDTLDLYAQGVETGIFSAPVINVNLGDQPIPIENRPDTPRSRSPVKQFVHEVFTRCGLNQGIAGRIATEWLGMQGRGGQGGHQQGSQIDRNVP
jgi:hypothetical protein